MSTPVSVEPHNQVDYNYTQQVSQTWDLPTSPMFTKNPSNHQQQAMMIPSSPHHPISLINFNHNTGLGIPISTYVPSPLDDLHLECTYLNDALQHENIKATELRRKLTAVEGYLRRDHFPLPKKKLKKQITWLNQRLDETFRQEQAILTQLGRVAYQIQTRERAVYLHNEFQQSLLREQIAGMQLNPTVPPFRPKALLPGHVPATVWQQHLQEDYSSKGQTYNDQSAECSDFEDIPPLELVVLSQENPGSFNLGRPSWIRRTVSMNDAELGLSRRHTFRAVPKRLSLPAFQTFHRSDI